MNDPMIVSLRQPKQVQAEPAPEPRFSERRPKERRKFPVFIVLWLVVFLFIGGSLYWYLRDSGTDAGTNNEAEIQEEVNDVVTKVGQLIMLPAGEIPTVATVSDPQKLQGQAFFENAKVGHKVLIYTKARKAYLYDPEAHKLIEVAPITTDLQ